MRAFSVLIVLAMLPSLTLAGLKDDSLYNQRIKRSAVELFRSGAAGSAVSYLQQNLRPEAGPDGQVLALAQNLVDIATTFYNRREINLAREAALQALLAADPILRGQSQASAVRKADLYGSLGVLHESVMFDLKAAQSFYDAAAALNPGDDLHRRRKKMALEKEKLRKGAGQ